MKHTLAIVAVIGASAFVGCLMVDLPPAALRQSSPEASQPEPPTLDDAATSSVSPAVPPTGPGTTPASTLSPAAPWGPAQWGAPAGNACSTHDGCFSKSCQVGSCEGNAEGEPCRTQRDCAADFACQAQICTLVTGLG